MSWEFTLLDALQCIHTPVLDKLMVGVTFWEMQDGSGLLWEFYYSLQKIQKDRNPDFDGIMFFCTFCKSDVKAIGCKRASMLDK